MRREILDVIWETPNSRLGKPFLSKLRVEKGMSDLDAFCLLVTIRDKMSPFWLDVAQSASELLSAALRLEAKFLVPGKYQRVRKDSFVPEKIVLSRVGDCPSEATIKCRGDFRPKLDRLIPKYKVELC